MLRVIEAERALCAGAARPRNGGDAVVLDSDADDSQDFAFDSAAARCRSHASEVLAITSRSLRRGFQPSTEAMRDASAINTGGSPARRGRSIEAIGAPFARPTASSTSRTE